MSEGIGGIVVVVVVLLREGLAPTAEAVAAGTEGGVVVCVWPDEAILDGHRSGINKKEKKVKVSRFPHDDPWRTSF